MKGLAINFNADASAEVVLDRSVTGAPAVAQNALVFCGCSKTTDLTYPERGSSLLQSALDGDLGTLQGARHAANFACLDARRFVSITTDLDESLAELRLDPTDLNLYKLVLQASVTTTLGNTYGLVFNTAAA